MLKICVLALAVLVPLAGAQQGALGQITDTPANRGRQTNNACPTITQLESSKPTDASVMLNSWFYYL